MLDTSLGHICTKLQVGERCGWNGRGFQRTCPTLKGRWKGFSERNRAGVVLLCYNYALLTGCPCLEYDLCSVFDLFTIVQYCTLERVFVLVGDVFQYSVAFSEPARL